MTETFCIFDKILLTQIIFTVRIYLKQGIFLGLCTKSIQNAQIFLESIEIFLYNVLRSLIRQLACSQVTQQLASE